MQVILISAVLAVILCYLWYASLVKKRQLAHDTLMVLDHKVSARLALMQSLYQQDKVALRTITSLNEHLLKFDDKGRLNLEVLSPVFANWQSVDTELKLLLQNLNANQLDEEQINHYLQLEQDYHNSGDFYNRVVSELNQGVKMFPGSIVAHFAGIVALPELEIDAASHSEVTHD